MKASKKMIMLGSHILHATCYAGIAQFAHIELRNTYRRTTGPHLARVARVTAAAFVGFNISTASATPVWPGDFAGRLAALAVIETLDAELLSHDSATLTLDRWCASHKLADGAKVVADRIKDVDKPANAELRKTLAVGDAEPIRYRRVELRCGEHVLSKADNWYVPSRLTTAMNQVLDTTDTAFGRAVANLHFQRHTLASELLWHPLPPGWDMERSESFETGPLTIPDAILQHRAFLTLRDATPFSVVVETYTGSLLDFPPPTAR